MGVLKIKKNKLFIIIEKCITHVVMQRQDVISFKPVAYCMYDPFSLNVH